MWFGRNKIKPKNNTFIRQWMTKYSEKSPRLKVISQYLKLYYEYSTINSLKYLADSRRPWFESFKANITNQTVDEILNLLMQLGNLYLFNFNLDDNYDVELDKLLTTYYNGSYDVTEIMKALTPQCSIMLLMCKLHGIYENCSTLFKFRKTQDGYCCTFNYIRESDDILEMNNVEMIEPQKVSDLGIERGLTVLMNPLLDDCFYSILPIKGWKVIVFNPTDYPDKTSGGVTEVLAMPLSETFLDMVATLFVSTAFIKNFPRNKRNCVFSDEGKLISGNTMYTYSDCIVDCKVYYIQKHCGCRPFFYPRRGKKDYSSRICNSLDNRCLIRHKANWSAILPHEEEHTNFEKEERALHCYNCYASCNDDFDYDVLSWKTHMTPGIFNTNFLLNYNVTNEGIVHIYFSKYETIRLIQDTSFYWYDLVSDIGGICGVFIGFSFISIVELLYFFMLMFSDFLCKKSALQEDKDRKTKIPSVQTQTTGAIYWNELQPRSWHSAKYGKFSINRARY
ncbi:PREDICTED: sodium channel protein Nach-like [Cyphomyrmex costatus]|uniref:sodium channel protein Nach-like n=1 Tax=Cyphomyrmex costatus TaxID=456900 RepID=UPI0008523774|nr:PREDICTED: sodium channel protein Nach-like [Cyphomyrmex costatus]